MNYPFTPPGGPFDRRPQIGGFGFGPHLGAGPGADPRERRALNEQRRHGRRAFRDAVRAQAADGNDARFGPGFGRGFGFGPGGFGPGGGGRGRGRGRRGDVRAAILKLLAERPMHGYEMIQEIAERSQDLWKPSPGSVYPTLQLLVDEGLIVATESQASEGSKKLFELTDDGRTAADKIATPPWDEITEGADPGHASLRTALGQLAGAIAQSALAATPQQQQRIVDIVNNARREVYGILGESE